MKKAYETNETPLSEHIFASWMFQKKRKEKAQKLI
jgi:hypothetical protein